jgi:hypothetical protein
MDSKMCYCITCIATLYDKHSTMNSFSPRLGQHTLMCDSEHAFQLQIFVELCENIPTYGASPLLFVQNQSSPKKI